MKIKSLAIAAALATTAGAAQAADLGHPVKAAVDYVKVCDAYGAGFFYIPGGDTCLQIAGYVQFRAVAGDSKEYESGDYIGALGGNWTRNSFWSETEIELDFDARTNTEFGLLRSYIAIRYDYDSGAAPYITLERGYVQWGGLTAGRTESNFAFYTGDTLEIKYGEVFGGGDQQVNLLAYTFNFGNGVTATISLEDSTTNARTGSSSINVFTGSYSYFSTLPLSYTYSPDYYDSTFTYGGNKAPDIVANLHVEQAWGKAQVMGALHYVNGANSAYYDYQDSEFVGSIPAYLGTYSLYLNSYGTVGPDNHSVSKWGWAVGAGVTLNVPTFGAGDTVTGQVIYSEGAIKLASDQFFSAYDLGVDGVVNAYDGSLHLTKAWTVGVGFDHHFTPTVDLAFAGGYLNTRVANPFNDGIDSYGDIGYDEWSFGANLNWTPVKGLEISGVVEYANVNFTSGTVNDYFDSEYVRKSNDAWLVGLQVKRNF